MSEHVTTLHVPDKFEVTDALMAGTNKAIGEQLKVSRVFGVGV